MNTGRVREGWREIRTQSLSLRTWLKAQRFGSVFL
jgi:hypothetical protein